jgi:hypothetical protein
VVVTTRCGRLNRISEEIRYKFAIAILLLSADQYEKYDHSEVGRRTDTSDNASLTPSPPATATQTTGASNQDPKVKAVNEEEKKKIEKEGK